MSFSLSMHYNQIVLGIRCCFTEGHTLPPAPADSPQAPVTKGSFTAMRTLGELLPFVCNNCLCLATFHDPPHAHAESIDQTIEENVCLKRTNQVSAARIYLSNLQDC